MVQVILRYAGRGPTPAEDLERLHSLDGLRILEESGRMVLVEAGRQRIEELVSLFPGWISAPVRTEIGLPEPGPYPVNPPRQLG